MSDCVIGVLSISSKHVREVSDPVGELLSQVHKIVYLSKVVFTIHHTVIIIPPFSFSLFLSFLCVLAHPAQGSV